MRLELTRRGNYAVRAMLLLARTDQDLLPSDRIAEAMGIPARFMRAVMRDLHQAGLVEAVTGRAGATGGRGCPSGSACSSHAACTIRDH